MRHATERKTHAGHAAEAVHYRHEELGARALHQFPVAVQGGGETQDGIDDREHQLGVFGCVVAGTRRRRLGRMGDVARALWHPRRDRSGGCGGVHRGVLALDQTLVVWRKERE